MTKRIVSAILVLVLIFALVPNPGVSAAAAETSDTYTYDTYLTTPADTWNPLTWTSASDSSVMSYLQTPFVDYTIKDSASGEYQWAFLAATAITDVTAAHQEDLVTYGVTNTEAQSGYIYEISLNPALCWEDGTPINADSYIYSMQQMLDPKQQNYRGADYATGTRALAGALEYYHSGNTVMVDNSAEMRIGTEEDLVPGEDGNYYTAEGEAIYIILRAGVEYLGGNALEDYISAYGEEYFDMEAYEALKALEEEDGSVRLNANTLALLQALISVPSWGEDPSYFINYIFYERAYPEVDWNTVGLYKVDDYTIRYVLENPSAYYDFLTTCTSNWLVHEDLYNRCLAVGNYCTNAQTTMSYGPYRMESSADGTLVLVRNEKYFEYTTGAGGKLSSVTSFLVDGKQVPQWQTDRVVIRTLSNEEAKHYFLNGELDEWTPSNADELIEYAASPRMFSVPESYTFRIAFNCGLENLQYMDAEHGAVNSVVLSNRSFRKAFSLAIDRAEFAASSAGYSPAVSLINELYFYDVYNDPASVYRKSDAAMQGICDLYDVKYGPGTDYATLQEAYESIDGYNLEEAQALMAQACMELEEAGLYTAGDPIVILAGLNNTTMLTLLTQYLNAAAQGSGFGTIELSRIDANRFYEGTAAFMISGWGGAAFNPFQVMQCYCDTDYYLEGGSYDPSVETVTLEVGGEEYTMTWQEWAKTLGGGYGIFTDMDMMTKVEALAKLESTYLAQYYAIPLFCRTANNLLSYQVDYYTNEYNTMYGFGGLRLMRYNYTDAQWEAYVASGKLDYTGGCGNDHDYTAVVTQPTCTEKGYTTYTCTRCGDSYVSDEVASLGHDYVGRICTRCGHEIPWSEYAPAKPYKIVNTVSGVHVYWNAEEGVSKYGLWRSETGANGTYQWIGNPTTNHFTDTKVTSGKTYYYKVSFLDTETNKHSAKSDALGIVYVATPDITSRVNKAAGIELSWNKITGATGYAVYRKSYSGTDAWVRVGTITSGSTTSWTDTSVKNNNGTAYRYTVRALAGSNRATLSGCRNSGRTMVRLTSQTLKSAAKAGATSVKCSWSTSKQVTGYEIRFVVDGKVYKTFTVGNYITGVKTFTGLKAGQTYQIQVRTYKKVDGVGSFYSAWSVAKYVTL